MRNVIVFALFLISFASNAQDPKKKEPPKVVVAKHILPSKHQFYRDHPTVKTYTWYLGGRVVLHLKDGSKEEYYLERTQDQNNYNTKYRYVPEIPPPPPPVDLTSFKPPVVHEFYKRNPNVELTSYSKDKKKFIVLLKSGVREEYYLDDQTQKNVFIEKYGELPVNLPPKAQKVQ